MEKNIIKTPDKNDMSNELFKVPKFYYNVRLDEIWELTNDCNSFFELEYLLPKSDYGIRTTRYFFRDEFIPFYDKEELNEFIDWMHKQEHKFIMKFYSKQK